MVFHRRPPKHKPGILDSDVDSEISETLSETRRNIRRFAEPATKKEDLDIPYWSRFRLLHGTTYKDMYEPKCVCEQCLMMSESPDRGMEAIKYFLEKPPTTIDDYWMIHFGCEKTRALGSHVRFP